MSAERWVVLPKPYLSTDFERGDFIKVVRRGVGADDSTRVTTEGVVRVPGLDVAGELRYIDIGSTVRLHLDDVIWFTEEILIRLPPLPDAPGSIIKVNGKAAVLTDNRIWGYTTGYGQVGYNDLIGAEVLFDAGE